MTQGSSLTARSERLWLLGILLLVVALRFIAAGSDPMPDLDAGFISDSGTWWKNPKQHLLWGQWFMDDGNFGILTAPAHALAQRAVFGLFGLGYAQGFLLSGVSGVVSTVLVFGLVRREHDAVPALLAAAFAGIDVLMLAYDRAAYPEPFQLMLMLAAVGAVLASRGRAWLAALGGVAVVAVLLAKPPGLVLAPIAATAWLALWITDRVREPSAAARRSSNGAASPSTQRQQRSWWRSWGWSSCARTRPTSGCTSSNRCRTAKRSARASPIASFSSAPRWVSASTTSSATSGTCSWRRGRSAPRASPV
ncbi:MAG: glycosyltransferase family 39 protein [Gemmatimonadetes bacterium]|nr:glycosyltransferase family 39 protein [Gemmatimonadota bacterium]